MLAGAERALGLFFEPQWHAWLAEHADRGEGVWLVSWKKATGRPALTYDEAVCEALAVGWVDATAGTVDADPGGDHRVALSTLRSAVEHAVREVVDRVPRAAGVGPLSGDAALSGALADLAVYVRQHHGERDHAALGAQVRAGLRAGR